MTRQALRILFLYMRPFAWTILLTVGLMLLMSFLEGFGYGMLVPILQEMQKGGEGPGADLFSRYTAEALSVMDFKYTFLNMIGLFSALMFVKFCIQGGLDYLSRYLSATLKYVLRNKVFGKLMELPISFYNRQSTGALISTAFNSADFGGAIAESSVRLATGVLAIALYVGMQLIISPSLTAISLVLTGASYWFIVPRFRTGFQMSEDVKVLMDNIMSRLQEALGAIRTIKAFNREEKHIREFGAEIDAFRKKAIDLVVNKVIANMYLEPYSTALIVILMVVSVSVLKLDFSVLLVFFVLFSRLIPRIKQVNSEILEFLQSLPHLIKVHELIEEEEANAPSKGSLEITSLTGDIRFEGVWFRYGGREESALRGIDFEIKRRRTTALVGVSGGGKTTIANLLLRFQDPTQGAIRVDGRDLKELNRDQWLSLIGMVEQEPLLFRASIAENIRYGKLDASEEEIRAAARMANAHEFVSALPEGYDTVVGDRGATLSGGQKQRVALARALIRDPELIVLDEATSALDSASERFIQESIEHFRAEKTILVIAHRLSTVMDADHIVLLDQGRIAEEGTHRELIEKGGAYAQSWRLQTMQERDGEKAAADVNDPRARVGE